MTEESFTGVQVDGARDAGFDPDGLRRAFALLEAWAAEGVFPGAGALVARGGQVAGEAYVGWANRAQRRPATAATIWSLASVTKPFTATAVMQLVERGVLALDEPLYQLVPEFLDAPETAYDRRAVTLRHVLAHCSGLPGFSEDNTALRRRHEPLESFVRSFARQPLFFSPGSAHLYSNCGMLMAAEATGRALSGTLGRRLDTPAVGHYYPHVAEAILAPLGMKWSALKPPSGWDERIAWVERTGQEGLDWEGANSAYYRSLGIPWGGLFSTPRELARFVDLFLPGAAGRQRLGLATRANGRESGTRILSPRAAQAMVTVQFAPPDASKDVAPDLRDASAEHPPRPVVEWGIGWEVKGTKRLHRTGDLTSPATYSHTGATGTMVWGDPEADVVCVFLTNRTAASGWTTERPRRTMFSNAVMAALR